MPIYSESFAAAFGLLASSDRDLMEILALSINVSLASLVLSCVIGLPIGAFLAMRHFPMRDFLVGVFNAMMGLPPRSTAEYHRPSNFDLYGHRCWCRVDGRLDSGLYHCNGDRFDAAFYFFNAARTRACDDDFGFGWRFVWRSYVGHLNWHTGNTIFSGNNL